MVSLFFWRHCLQTLKVFILTFNSLSAQTYTTQASIQFIVPQFLKWLNYCWSLPQMTTPLSYHISYFEEVALRCSTDFQIFFYRYYLKEEEGSGSKSPTSSFTSYYNICKNFTQAACSRVNKIFGNLGDNSNKFAATCRGNGLCTINCTEHFHINGNFGPVHVELWPEYQCQEKERSSICIRNYFG